MVAQSCEETGYGTSNLAVNSKNLFGITGRGTNGKTGNFSSNKKLVDSTKQYAKLMKKSIYYKKARNAIKKNPKDVAKSRAWALLFVLHHSQTDWDKESYLSAFISVSLIRFFFNVSMVSWLFLKSSNCLYAFSLNIFNLSILGTSCLIKSAFVSSRLISTTNSSAEAKSLILGV